MQQKLFCKICTNLVIFVSTWKNIAAFTLYLMIFSTAAPVDKILDEDQDNLAGAGMWFVLQLTTSILYIRRKVI